MIEKILEEILKELSPALDPTWNSVVFWRVISLAELILLVLVWKNREKILTVGRKPAPDPEQVAHDRKIFQVSMEVMGEGDLSEFMSDLDANHLIIRSKLLKFERYIDFHSKLENQYLNAKLREKAVELTKCLAALNNFTGLNFFVTHSDGDETLYRMQPSYSFDYGGSTPEDGEKYEQYTEKLQSFIKPVYQNYRDYRMAVKQELKM